MIEYTLGFLFNKQTNKVLLLHRQDHEFHAFKHNGIGGKIMLGESPVECIIRETEEETGLHIDEKHWKFTAILKAPSWKVWVFATKLDLEPATFPEIKEGTLAWYEIGDLPETSLSNLHWLIPLCIDVYQNPELQSIVGWYSDGGR